MVALLRLIRQRKIRLTKHVNDMLVFVSILVKISSKRESFYLCVTQANLIDRINEFIRNSQTFSCHANSIGLN